MQVYNRKCEICGKSFLAFSPKKYCSKDCMDEARERRREGKEQLCWRCKNACGGCSWSRCLKPVKGWAATPTVIRDSMIGDMKSYKITACPEFVADDEEVQSNDIA